MIMNMSFAVSLWDSLYLNLRLQRASHQMEQSISPLPKIIGWENCLDVLILVWLVF